MRRKERIEQQKNAAAFSAGHVREARQSLALAAPLAWKARDGRAEALILAALHVLDGAEAESEGGR